MPRAHNSAAVIGSRLQIMRSSITFLTTFRRGSATERGSIPPRSFYDDVSCDSRADD